jgi:FkbM family methyltransferase
MSLLDRLRRGRRLPPSVRVRSDVGPLLLPEGDQMIAVTLERDGVWEPEEGEALRQLVEPGMTVLDIGAHCGYFTLMLSKQVGHGGRVVAVEAAPENFALLGANVEAAGAGNVRLVQGVAWRRSGEPVELSLSADNTGDHRAYLPEPGRRVIKLKSLAIDDLDPALDALDLVKIDIQATEQIAIEGMRRTIERFRPRLMVEFWPRGIRELGDNPEDVVSLYRELGLEIEAIERPGQGPGLSPTELVALADASPTEFLNLLLTPRELVG